MLYNFNRANKITLKTLLELKHKLTSVAGSIGDLELSSIIGVMELFNISKDKDKELIKNIYIEHLTSSPNAYDIVLVCCNYCTTEDNPTSPISAASLSLEQAGAVVWGVLETVFKKKG